MPIIHTGIASVMNVPLGKFLTDAGEMARAISAGRDIFGFDGVHLSMGVTGEAEALGAKVDQPENGGPILREKLLSDWNRLSDLKNVDATKGGRMPMFFDAVRRVVDAVGSDTYVLANLRGPLLAASQLRGVEQILIDLIDSPEQAGALLDFTTDLAAKLGDWLIASGAHGLVLGEATCSPNFISPNMYRESVLPRHRELVSRLKASGWKNVGFHICGNTIPIIEDVVSTGADFMDIDYQVPARTAIEAAAGRMGLRGNLDPSSQFRFGTPESVAAATRAVMAECAGSAWVLSSGCDIPPGTPAENIAAFTGAARG